MVTKSRDFNAEAQRRREEERLSENGLDGTDGKLGKTR
jgi:hypothetical protein